MAEDISTMLAWRKTLTLFVNSVIVEFELHTRKITLDLLKKEQRPAFLKKIMLAVSPKRIRILLKACLLETKTELGESDT